MKKEYRKPVIVIEDFTVSTNIATNCEVDTGDQSNNICGIDFSGYVVFLEGMNGCTSLQVPNEGGDGEWNGLCYHVPYNESILFNS